MARIMVLVVEDERDVRRAIARILTRAGFDVFEADGAREAIVALRSGAEFGIVVTDLEMPDMNGETLLGKIRLSDPLLPVIVLSGRADPQATSADLGVSCLAKPFHPDELVDAVVLATAAGSGSERAQSKLTPGSRPAL